MDWKKYAPHAIAVVVMAIISLMYCSPVLQGKKLVQDDIIKNIAQGKESRDYREANGEEALWTTRVFSGMTTFNISTIFSTNIIEHIKSAFIGWLPNGANQIFALFVGFYIMLVLLGVNHWLALVLALGYGLSSNLTVSILAGHNTKVLSIAFMAPALGGVLLALNGKQFIGSLVAMFFVGIMITSNHYQIMYYFALISMVIGIVHFYFSAVEKTLNTYFKALALVIVAGLIAVLPNVGKVYNTIEHSKETIRGGKSELTVAEEQKKEGGLDKEYAMRWSYSPMETFTLVIPSFMGGASGEALPKGGNVEEALKKFNLNKQQKEGILGRAPLYMGDQPFVLGTVYFGAGFIFLFIMGLFLLNGPIRIWTISLLVMSLIMSWGRHLDIVTGFLFDYFPMYNKFRTPSMALAIAGLVIPLFGALALNKIFANELDQEKFKKAFKFTMYTVGGIMVFLLLYGITSDWIGPKDAQYQTKNSPWAIEEVYDALLADRKGRYMSDWFISALVMAITAGVIWFFRKGKLGLTAAIAVIGFAYTADMWRVAKRYLNEESFVSEREYNSQFNPSPADQAILQDPDPHYRVVNLTRNPWTDGLTCYHHKNVGGHHAAKLQRYQDLIERELSTQLQKINSGLGQNGQRIVLNPEVASSMPVYNMLNTKYYIVQDNNPAGAVINPAACGNAWFVSEVKKVNSADEEMAALANFNPLNTAVIHNEFDEQIAGLNLVPMKGAYIKLEESSPKFLKYSSQSSADGLVVFSEVYYPQGWVAYVDGQPTDIIRANYILRAIKVPAGDHTVEMRFEPASYTLGNNLSLAGSALFVLFGAGMLFYYNKNRAA